MSLKPIDYKTDVEILEVVCDISEIKNLRLSRKNVKGGAALTTGLVTLGATVALGPVGFLLGGVGGSIIGGCMVAEGANLKASEYILTKSTPEEKRKLSLKIRQVITDENITTFEDLVAYLNVRQNFRDKMLMTVKNWADEFFTYR